MHQGCPPNPSFLSTSAPFSIKNSATSTCPSRDARINAVCNKILFTLSTLAPASIKSLTALTFHFHMHTSMVSYFHILHLRQPRNQELRPFNIPIFTCIRQGCHAPYIFFIYVSSFINQEIGRFNIPIFTCIHEGCLAIFTPLSTSSPLQSITQQFYHSRYTCNIKAVFLLSPLSTYLLHNQELSRFNIPIFTCIHQGCLAKYISSFTLAPFLINISAASTFLSHAYIKAVLPFISLSTLAPF